MPANNHPENLLIPQILENGFGFNVYRVGLLFRRELMKALAEYSLTPEQWQVMMTLWHTSASLNQNEIAKMLLKDKHTVSRIIQRLERDGWIKKTASPKDARATIVELTAKGKSFQEEVPKKLFSHFDKVLKDFDNKEIRTMLKSLKKLREILGDY